MTTLTVEGKQFDLESLSEEAQAIAHAISFTDAKIKQTEQELMMSRAARAYYVSELLKVLPEQTEAQEQPAKTAATRKRSASKKSTSARSKAAAK